jgi:putative tricarboxylic transport membrane protein
LTGDIAAAFADVASVRTVAWLAAGIVFGYVVGVLPGLNRPTALALALPVSYFLPAVPAIAFLVGIAKGGAAGGAITAILLNTPGEPSSAATCLDGYPMARRGEGEKALTAALYAAVIGDLVATLALVALAQPLAKVALKLGPVEIGAILLLSLAFVASLSGGSMFKGLAAACLGVFAASAGLDIETGAPRLTFGFIELYDGIPLLAVGIGMLALSEMLVQMETAQDGIEPVRATGPVLSAAEMRACAPAVARGSVVGIVVGILPGLGATVAAFLSYALAKRAARDPGRFGKGAVEGVAAAESADNAVTAAAMIPLFALGIPGSVAAAILIGAFTIHGVAPGPLMFEQNARLVYAVYGAMLLASLLVLLVGRVGLKAFVHVARVPDRILCPGVVFLCVIGAWLEGGGLFAVGLMLVFGFLGYAMRKAGLSFVTFLIGFILGPMLELSARQTIVLTGGDPAVLLRYPLALGIAAVALMALFYLARRPTRET